MFFLYSVKTFIRNIQPRTAVPSQHSMPDTDTERAVATPAYMYLRSTE